MTIKYTPIQLGSKEVVAQLSQDPVTLAGGKHFCFAVLTFFQRQGSGDSVTAPQSVDIFGEPSIIALRDALNKAYPVETIQED